MMRTTNVFHKSLFIKKLPEPHCKNMKNCWEILNEFTFIHGSLFSLAVVTSSSPPFKGWRIALESAESFELTTTIHSSHNRFPGAVPFPKYLFVGLLENYLKNILPAGFEPCNISFCHFTDDLGKYRRAWVVDLRPCDTSSELKKRNKQLTNANRKVVQEHSTGRKRRHSVMIDVDLKPCDTSSELKKTYKQLMNLKGMVVQEHCKGRKRRHPVTKANVLGKDKHSKKRKCKKPT